MIFNPYLGNLDRKMDQQLASVTNLSKQCLKSSILQSKTIFCFLNTSLILSIGRNFSIQYIFNNCPDDFYKSITNISRTETIQTISQKFRFMSTLVFDQENNTTIQASTSGTPDALTPPKLKPKCPQPNAQHEPKPEQPASPCNRPPYLPQMSLSQFGSFSSLTLSYKTGKLSRMGQDDFNLLVDQLSCLADLPFSVELRCSDNDPDLHQIFLAAAFMANKDEFLAVKQAYFSKMKVVLQALIGLVEQIGMRAASLDTTKTIVKRIMGRLQQ